MKLLVATRNAHKLEEIYSIFSMASLELIGADAIPGLPEVEEDASTFEGNAIKKAVTLALASRLWTLADDSGLEVDALDGAPGVYSARYAGEPPDYKANNSKLLSELGDNENRSARFRCVIALSSPEGKAMYVEGKCEGVITAKEWGDHGFGYDPLFMPDGFDVTFAQMAPDAKNRISHRAQALHMAMEKWKHLFGNDEL